MNSDQLAGNWLQVKGKLREQWGKLTDDHVEQIKGDQEMLVGKIQELYGITKEEAEKQVSHFGGKFKNH